jgi:hypothetical protein
MLDDGLDINTFSLRKHRKKYGTYQGCYNKYEGPLLEAYKEIKMESALKISEDFASKWCDEDDVMPAQAAKEEEPKEKIYLLKDLLGIFDMGRDRMQRILSKAKHDNPMLETRYRKGKWYLKEDDLTILRGYV